MRKPYYSTYLYKNNEGFMGIRFMKKVSVMEPINERLHEDFINEFSFMNIYGTLKQIHEDMDKQWKEGKLWKVQHARKLLKEYYLQLLLKYRMSNLSVCMYNSRFGNPFVCRLDCLTHEQFLYLIEALDLEYRTNMMVWDCKIGDLKQFMWKGV